MRPAALPADPDPDYAESASSSEDDSFKMSRASAWSPAATQSRNADADACRANRRHWGMALASAVEAMRVKRSSRVSRNRSTGVRVLVEFVRSMTVDPSTHERFICGAWYVHCGYALILPI